APRCSYPSRAGLLFKPRVTDDWNNNLFILYSEVPPLHLKELTEFFFCSSTRARGWALLEFGPRSQAVESVGGEQIRSPYSEGNLKITPLGSHLRQART